MSTLQASAQNALIPRLLVWAPAGVGALLALGVLAVGSFPLIAQVQLQGRQVEDKRAQQQQLPQLRADLARTAQQQLLAERQQQQLISLIAGSGELVTFMAQADREARRHGVQLQLFEPTAALAPGEGEEVDALKGQKKGTKKKLDKKAAARKQAEAAQQRDPLLKAGLVSTKLLLSAKGRYPNLLAFMRSLEALSLLVVQSNLALNQGVPASSAGSAKAAELSQLVTPVELKLAVALYNAKT